MKEGNAVKHADGPGFVAVQRVGTDQLAIRVEARGGAAAFLILEGTEIREFVDLVCAAADPAEEKPKP